MGTFARADRSGARREGIEMTRIMAVRVAMPLALVVGLGLPADAQQPADTKPSSPVNRPQKRDRRRTASVPDGPHHLRYRKLCRGNMASENFKIDCFDVLEGWPADLNIVDQDFTCFISGTACGVPDLQGKYHKIGITEDSITGIPASFCGRSPLQLAGEVTASGQRR